MGRFLSSRGQPAKQGDLVCPHEDQSDTLARADTGFFHLAHDLALACSLVNHHLSGAATNKAILNESVWLHTLGLALPG
jgi:hypothetical protein